MSIRPYDIDIPVLLIFFCRHEQFQKVFEAVKKARPSKLYLYQDGARENRPDDLIGIQKCREIAEEIDWECQVYKLYQEHNFGCDPSEYIAQKWMFENEEMGIVLEDDDVPSQSFFPFCKQLLEEYKNNDQINIICGMNNTEVSTHIESDYLFTVKGSIWGWASWRRVIDTWDETYSWLDDEKKIDTIRNSFSSSREFQSFINTATEHRNSGKPHYESILAASLYLNSRMNIVPKYNMISNIGISQETTHSVDNIEKLPRKIRSLLYMKTYEISFPLKHPDKIKRDYIFEKTMTMSSLDIIYNKLEAIILRIKFKDIKGLCNALLKRVRKYKF